MSAFPGVLGLLGKVFGLRRRERIAYSRFSRISKKLQDEVRNSVQKTHDLEVLGESFFILLRIRGHFFSLNAAKDVP